MPKQYVPGTKHSKIVKNMAEATLIKVTFNLIINFFAKCINRVRMTIDGFFAKIVRKIISSRTAVAPNKVVFMHYANKYQCNPSYICDEILRQGLDWELVYIVDKKSANGFISPCPEGVRVVGRNTIDHFYEMASAKFWVENAVCFPWEYVPKKDDQIYINTWHGSMGLKRIDAQKIVQKKWAKSAKIASRITDYMISNSSFETEVYRGTYWSNPDVKILELGHPRNDILFSDEGTKNRIRKKVCDFFGLPEDAKLLLYAPTFRDAKNIDCYDLDYDMLLEALHERFGGNWFIVNRYHFKVAKNVLKRRGLSDHPFIVDGNKYADIQELMTACDAGITDYSSWICDFVLTGKPGFIYANDLKEYDNERGFYYPLDSTPFPIAEDNVELFDNIISFDAQAYEKDTEQFLKDRGCKESGTAAKQVVELMRSLMDENN